MSNTNGLLECTTVCSTGAADSNLYERINNPGTEAPMVPFAGNPGKRGTQTTRPLFVNTNTAETEYPGYSLFRLLEIVTVTTPGLRYTVVDASGNQFTNAEWTCIVAGFNNDVGDRTYNCWCEVNPSTGVWQVAYDQAGGAGCVRVLAIANALFIGGPAVPGNVV